MHQDEYGRKRSQPNLKYYHGGNETTNLIQHSMYPSRGLNRVPPELNVMITSNFLKDYSPKKGKNKHLIRLIQYMKNRGTDHKFGHPRQEIRFSKHLVEEHIPHRVEIRLLLHLIYLDTRRPPRIASQIEFTYRRKQIDNNQVTGCNIMQVLRCYKEQNTILFSNNFCTYTISISFVFLSSIT